MTEPSIAEIAARVALASDDATVVLAAPQGLAAVADDLLDELQYLAEDDGLTAVHVHAATAEELLRALVALPKDTPALVTDLPGLSDAELASLDRQRNRLMGGPNIVVLTTSEGASRLARLAPNLWSWIGSRLWEVAVPVPGVHPAEVRLQGMREALGLSDEEVLARAEAGSLPNDPVFAEWLALLGRGELLGR